MLLDDLYDISYVILSPTQQDIPAERNRIYIVGKLACHKWRVPYDCRTMKQMLHRKTELKGDFYFARETLHMHKSLITSMANKREMPELKTASYKFPDVCCDSVFKNITGVMNIIQNRSDGDNNFNFNCEQDIDFSNLTRVVPALLRKSRIFNCKSQSVLCHLSHQKFQG